MGLADIPQDFRPFPFLTWNKVLSWDDESVLVNLAVSWALLAKKTVLRLKMVSRRIEKRVYRISLGFNEVRKLQKLFLLPLSFRCFGSERG
jgi:hypothetical protein